jgi:hypothetical protein
MKMSEISCETRAGLTWGAVKIKFKKFIEIKKI